MALAQEGRAGSGVAHLRRRPRAARATRRSTRSTRRTSRKLEVAWRFKTDALGPRPEFNFQSTPLMVGGVIYATAGTRRAVVALDATTGEMLWMHSENEGQARRVGAAAALRPRRRVLERRPQRAHRLRHAGLPADRARREDRRADSRLRQERRRRSQGRQRSGARSDHRRDRPARGAAHRAGRHHRRCRAPVGRARRRAARTPRATCARSTSGPGSASGPSTRSRSRASSATTRGKATPLSTPATPACGRRWRWTRSSGSRTCPWRCRQATTTAGTGREPDCSARASSPWS